MFIRSKFINFTKINTIKEILMLVKQPKTLLNKAFRALNPFEALHIVLTYVYNKLN